jgi:TrmH family RNA methyltransferase
LAKIFISTENAEYQIIHSLKINRTKRRQSGEVFMEGTECIKQAIRAQLEITRIIAIQDTALSDWAKDVIKDHPKAKIVLMTAKLYGTLCERDDPPELAITARISHFSIEDFIVPQKPFVLVLDRPSDRGNFGSLIRSANSFGVDAVFLVGHGIDPFDSKVIRSSLGSVFHAKILEIASMAELEEWVNAQKEKCDLRVIGTDSTGETSLDSLPLKKPVALILGNEAKGMSIALKNICDCIVSIPLRGSVNSLNVACAGSIFLYDIYRNSLADGQNHN